MLHFLLLVELIPALVYITFAVIFEVIQTYFYQTNNVYSFKNSRAVKNKPLKNILIIFSLSTLIMSNLLNQKNNGIVLFATGNSVNIEVPTINTDTK